MDIRVGLLVGVLLLIAALTGCGSAIADDARSETRLCGAPVRMSDGEIRRRADVLTAFKRTHACPRTGLTVGPCRGWYMDHVIPLACGGCDAVWNMQWLPEDQWRAKSKWERVVYGGRGMSPGCP